MLDDFLDAMFFEGLPPAKARYAVYGTAYCLGLPPRDRGTLPLAKAALHGFSRASPEQPRDSLPVEYLYLACDAWLRRGGELALVAAAAVIAFDCYLRPAEVLGLTVRHVTPPAPGALDAVITIAPFSADDPDAPPAKNFEFDASTIVGAHDRGWVAQLVLNLAARAAVARPGDASSPLLPGLTAARWAAACREFRAEFFDAQLPFSPHSFRHAGPSHDAWRFRASAAALQTRGRWLAASSVRRYAKPAGMLRRRSALTAAQLRSASVVEKELSHRMLSAFPAPPRPPPSSKRSLAATAGFWVPARSTGRSSAAGLRASRPGPTSQDPGGRPSRPRQR